MQNAENILFTITMIGYFGAMILYFLFVGVRKEQLAKAAGIIQGAALALHTAALVLRGIGAGRIPMTNQYEFATCFAWALCLVCLVFIRKYRFSVLGVFAMPVVFIIMGYAAMQSRDIKPLMPALQSGWLAFHVSTAIISYGAFGVSAALGAIYLMRGKVKENGFLNRHIPGENKLDLIAYRSVCLGLLFLTFTIITGAIWAERAWGSYWSWDPKEAWALVTLIIYSIPLHQESLPWFRSQRNYRIYSLIALASLLMTYFGVNFLLGGMHSYA